MAPQRMPLILGLGTAADAVDLGDYIIDLLTAYQLADALEVAIAAAQEEYLLDHVVLIGSHVNQFRAGAVSLVLDMFRLHRLNLICE